MQSRRKFLGSSIALAALPPLLSQATAATSQVVKLGIYSDTIFFLPLWIAKEKGFFDQAGVTLEFEPIATMKENVDALLEGTASIAMLGPEVAFLDKGGADRVRIIAGNANRPPHFLIAQPRFKKIGDLRGATFGVISLTEGTTFLVQSMMGKVGLTPSDYRIEAVGSAPMRVRLLDEGKIDAALQPFPLSYQAEAKGFSNLGWVGSVEPDWQFGVMLANRAWLQANRKLAANLVSAAIRGRRFMAGNRSEAAEIAARRMKTTPALARRAIDDALRLGIMDPGFRWSEEGLKKIYATLQRAGTIPPLRAFRIEDYVDTGPLHGQPLD